MKTLPPITREEKLAWTLKLNYERGTEELLAEAYEAGYEGYLDIWFELKPSRGELALEVRSQKLSHASVKPNSPNSQRFHVVQGKGCKRVR